MNKNQITRRILKRDLVPALETEGFKGKLPNFQRLENGTIHLLSIEFDKWGGGFFLEFACHPCGDLETTWGEIVAEKDIIVAHTGIESRARLQKKGNQNSLSEDWFRYEHLSENEIEELVQHVSSLIPQLNEWLREKRAGNNICTIKTHH